MISSLLPGAQGPGIAAVQKGAHHTRLVRLYFRVLCELVCPDTFLVSLESMVAAFPMRLEGEQ